MRLGSPETNAVEMSFADTGANLSDDRERSPFSKENGMGMPIS